MARKILRVPKPDPNPLLFSDETARLRAEEKWRAGWRDRALDCIQRLAGGYPSFTADHLRRMMKDDLPQNVNLGFVFQLAQRMNIIEDTGKRVPSTIKSNNGREVRVWRAREPETRGRQA